MNTREEFRCATYREKHWNIKLFCNGGGDCSNVILRLIIVWMETFGFLSFSFDYRHTFSGTYDKVLISHGGENTICYV